MQGCARVNGKLVVAPVKQLRTIVTHSVGQALAFCSPYPSGCSPHGYLTPYSCLSGKLVVAPVKQLCTIVMHPVGLAPAICTTDPSGFYVDTNPSIEYRVQPCGEHLDMVGEKC